MYNSFFLSKKKIDSFTVVVLSFLNFKFDKLKNSFLILIQLTWNLN